MIVELPDRTPTLHESVYVAPTAVVIGSVTAHEGCTVWFGAVLRADNDTITLGPRTNVQDGCVVHVDEGLPVTLGADCVVGHQATLHGCTLGDRVLVGIGARVLNRAVVEDDVIIGAGSLVPENARLESGWLYLGVPARKVRPVREDERARVAHGAAHYAEKGRIYRDARTRDS